MDLPGYQIINYLHVAAGGAAFIAAPIALIVKKGGKIHRLSGKIFVIGMSISIVAVLWNMGWLYYKEQSPFAIFFILLAIFSYYAIAISYRILYLKRLHKGQRPETIDWFIGISAFISCALFSGWGVYHLLTGSGGLIYILSTVFGSLGLFNVISNSRIFFVPPKDGSYVIPYHLGNMMGGYIAALTAFSVNVLDGMIPGIINWLWPTAIGVPLTIWFTHKYSKPKGLTKS